MSIRGWELIPRCVRLDTATNGRISLMYKEMAILLRRLRHRCPSGELRTLRRLLTNCLCSIWTVVFLRNRIGVFVWFQPELVRPTVIDTVDPSLIQIDEEDDVVTKQSYQCRRARDEKNGTGNRQGDASWAWWWWMRTGRRWTYLTPTVRRMNQVARSRWPMRWKEKVESEWI